MHSLSQQNAFANPSFMTGPPSSRPPSRSIDSPDKHSLKYIEDDDGFMEKSFVQLPKGDSGMVSLVDVRVWFLWCDGITYFAILIFCIVISCLVILRFIISWQ